MEGLLAKRSNCLGGIVRGGHARVVELTGNGDAAMPFKSQAQRRKFAQLLVEGKISNETFEEWNRETGRQRLPERVGAKRKASRKRKSSRKVRAAKKR